jgi:hypothetical protein
VKVKVELTAFLTIGQKTEAIKEVKLEPIIMRLSEIDVEVPDELVNVLKFIPNSFLRITVEGKAIIEKGKV